MTDAAARLDLAILHLDCVTRRYQTGPAAVDRVTLTLMQGELLALLGPSGCGKTTLLRLIAGLEMPNEGAIVLSGRPVAGPGGWVPPERRQLGMVFQDYALFPHLTVAQNVGFGLDRLRKQAPQALHDRVAEAIALVGLEGLEKRYPHELSGGQQQRVALARSIAPQPSLILLDEPLSNLDARVRQRLRQEVRAILKRAGAAAVFVTHDREEAMAIADRVAVMRRGQIEQIDSPEGLYWEPDSRFVAGFVAETNFLIATRSAQGWQTELGLILPEQLGNDPPGDRVELAIRQTDVTLEADPQGHGQLLERQFLGREYVYLVQLPSGERLQVVTDWRCKLEPGDRVHLKITSPRLRAFPIGPD
ncbi:ABC transporter ATP-binding protein [Limnothrix sp. FACHB-708]|uniref:ABC transporter ATP-binding protein n=1 Tax=unclassified Limnothrix TaxID=2632864 RepID=UPI001680CBBA|nr:MULTISPECIES: ABC transporter ATP-binding protein [unclassified Limnothrix]MBD2160657.1 ABC transporter ATP-binding protein [Limnothrix sp. FACHB-1083]MBD2191499.1 ABC transporter ATP-binding protein [Limnothrix sp. FACHB-1088]MBD2554055.1 ABC transporter ATP-binding protein [Limnothrix sp. FACHB-708]MBD2591770.1 ABC transporter ATP-binding protein [Limnothrix sp. FACHB-406]